MICIEVSNFSEREEGFEFQQEKVAFCHCEDKRETNKITN